MGFGPETSSKVPEFKDLVLLLGNLLMLKIVLTPFDDCRDEAEHHATLLYAGDNWARAANPSGPAYVYIRRRAVP